MMEPQFFVVVKLVGPDTRSWCSYINSNMDNTKKSQFKSDTPKSNLQIAEWTNEISIYGQTYS